MKRLRLTSLVVLASLLTACGGSDDTGLPIGPGQPPTAISTGKLIESPSVLTTMTTAQIDAAATANGLRTLSGAAQCAVKVVALNYTTVGPKGEDTNASGVLLAPTGTCTAAAPLLAYAKATDVQKPRTLANPQDGETFLLMAMYAAQGYAVVASDLLGYAKSSFPYHPYLLADSGARSVLDALRAARNAAPMVGLSLSNKVMFNGYSAGGHSSMAAQRSAERDHAGEFDVVAAAHMAGPYNVSGAIGLPHAIAGYQFFAPFLVTSYQKVYGDVYSDVNTVFKMPYASTIENLLPNPTMDINTLISSGALPGAQGQTPDQVRDALIQSAYLVDIQNNPANALRLDAKKNDLFGWNPHAPTLLCGGASDPTVPPAVHIDPLKADFDARGVKTVSTTDVDLQIQLTYGPNGKAPTDPTSPEYATYYTNYHGLYEPPLCHFRARAWFDLFKKNPA